MTRHLADKQDASTGGRVKAFMRIAREDRATESNLGWHRPHHDNQAAGEDGVQGDRPSSRLTHFMRIMRGRLS